MRAWSLLCGAPTWPESLWADLQGYVRPSRRDGAKLYRQRLPAAVVDECWERFNHALRPLAEAGKLGVVIVRFPSWFSPRPAAWEELAALTARLPGLRMAVELTNQRWYEGDACEQTLGVLEALGLCFVCRDSPGRAHPIVAATADIALVRLPGRAVRSWPAPRPPRDHGDGPVADSTGRRPELGARLRLPLQRRRTGGVGTGHPGPGLGHLSSAHHPGQLLAGQRRGQRRHPALVAGSLTAGCEPAWSN